MVRRNDSRPTFQCWIVMIALILVLPSASYSQHRSTEVESQPIEAMIQRSLELLQRSSEQTADVRSCFNCHGQALPVLALISARERGFKIESENLQRQLTHTHEHLSLGTEDYLRGKGQGGQVDTAGYAAWTLKAGGWAADQTTTALVEYLLKYQSDQDHWSSSSNRPPSEVSDFSATYVALLTIDEFGTPEQEDRIETRKSQVKKWLLAAEARDTEDHVFRLRSLTHLNVSKDLILQRAQELVAQQRGDGGWAQTSEMSSDAYATGSVMAALFQSGSVAADDTSYQRGIQFLIDNQKPDGSWHVVSRSKPFQTYFESGFPHGVDQVISATATGWAVLALLPAVGKTQIEPEESSRTFFRFNEDLPIVHFDAASIARSNKR